MEKGKIQFNSIQLEYLKNQWDFFYKELKNQWEIKQDIDMMLENMLVGDTKIEYKNLRENIDKNYGQALIALEELIQKIEKTNRASSIMDQKIGEGMKS